MYWINGRHYKTFDEFLLDFALTKKWLGFSPRFIEKYMRLARQVGIDQNQCLKHHFGTIIVNPQTNLIIGTGYNGPARNLPKCDSYDHLLNMVCPQLTDPEKITLLEKIPESFNNIRDINERIARGYENCGQCPQNLLKLKRSERSQVCGCSHSEANALLNCSQSTNNCYLFCWCGIPCFKCTGTIINAQITKVFCLKTKEDYSSGSRWMFGRAGVDIIEIDENKL